MSRSLFSGTDRAAYLNAAAEGLAPASLVAALSRYALNKPLGSDGRAGMLGVERRRREQVAALLGARPDEVAFWGRDGRLRVSIHPYNDSSDIDRLLEALPQP